MKPTRDRGFALLVVLWSLVLITLLTTQILASGRTALTLSGNLRAAAQARACADGAINEAIFHLVSSGADKWLADGSPRAFAFGAITVTVQINSLAGKINPNLASTKLLAGLFQAVGAPSGEAKQVADAIIAWRSPPVSKQDTDAQLAAYKRAGLAYGPPGQPFSDLSELSNIIGMPPLLLAKALPDLSLFQSGDPDPTLSDIAVRKALAFSGQAGSSSSVYNGTFPVVSITAEATGPGKLAVRRVAIVSIVGSNGAVPFQMQSLADDDGTASPDANP